MKIQYSADGNTAIYCGYKFRRDPQSGYYLCTKNTDVQRRERLHVFVWRKANGEIPEGYHIHHVDGNKRHNDIENLACISGSIHVSQHGKQRAEKEYDAIIDNLRRCAMPKAAEWHASEAGRLWHSEHAKEVAKNAQPKEFICEACGKVYTSLPIGQHKYCSNACRTRARVQSGVDDETRSCCVCGADFIANKYRNKKCCSKECSDEFRKNRKR